MSISYIYPIDEESLMWNVANELIGDNYKNRFILRKCYKTQLKSINGLNIFYVGFDGRSSSFFVPDTKIIRVKRKIKLNSLNDNLYSFEYKKKLNELRISSLNIKHSDNRNYGLRYKKEIKETPTQKRKRLAKENRSCGKERNR